MLDANQGQGMPRYFFHVLSGEIRQPDKEGKELPGDQSAFDYAVLGLQQLLATPFGKQINANAYSVEVATETGQVLFAVPMNLPVIQGS
jgi:hypothetical protein